MTSPSNSSYMHTSGGSSSEKVAQRALASATSPQINIRPVEVPLRGLLSASSYSRNVAERKDVPRMKVFISHRISQIPTCQ
eukprot:5153276-Pleurochrysis_carterae.AAC.1